MFGVLYLWLPYRVAVMKLFFRLGGSRVIMAMEYRELDSPHYVPVADAGRYPEDAEVLAVEWHDEARAIPLKRIAWHLIVNDEINGEPIAATLCTMADSAMVYRAVCNGKTLHFSPNRLIDNNLVMRDAETGSLWRQFTGEAFEGPLAGARLERITANRTSLAEWKRQRPNGMILEPAKNDSDTVAPNDTCPIMSYFPSEPFLLQPPRHEDSRLPNKRVVVGALLPDGKAVAWLASDKNAHGIDSTIQRVQCYWFAWVTFHPDTQLLTSASP